MAARRGAWRSRSPCCPCSRISASPRSPPIPRFRETERPNMPGIGFNEDILPIFSPFAPCMENITIATDQGVFEVDLEDYERVKLLHAFILTAIRGWDPATPTAHRMPPRAPLPAASIQKFAQWVDDGMPETRPVA